MALISMKNDPPKKSTLVADVDGDYDNSRPAYPYGLRLSLCAEDLAKLGITDLPAAGSKLQLMATVEVVGTGENSYLESDGKAEVNKNMELQITDMELQPGGEDKDNAAKLYG